MLLPPIMLLSLSRVAGAARRGLRCIRICGIQPAGGSVQGLYTQERRIVHKAGAARRAPTIRPPLVYRSSTSRLPLSSTPRLPSSSVTRLPLVYHSLSTRLPLSSTSGLPRAYHSSSTRRPLSSTALVSRSRASCQRGCGARAAENGAAKEPPGHGEFPARPQAGPISRNGWARREFCEMPTCLGPAPLPHSAVLRGPGRAVQTRNARPRC